MKEIFRFISHSTEDTEEAGVKFASTLKPCDIVAMYGGLGMGKTAFVRGMARGMKITDDVSSPTYALVHEYRGNPPLVHFDMYRVSGLDDLYSTGFFDYIESGAVCVVEWSENIEDALQNCDYRVRFERGTGENDRVVTVYENRTEQGRKA